MKESHSLRGFARLVREMRRAQVRYDGTIGNRATYEAYPAVRDLQSRVDAALREILDAEPGPFDHMPVED